MTIKQYFGIPNLQYWYRERYLIQYEVVVFVCFEDDKPDGAQHHSNVGAEGYESAKDGSWELVASYFDVEVLALLEASVRIEVGSVDLHFVVTELQG